MKWEGEKTKKISFEVIIIRLKRFGNSRSNNNYNTKKIGASILVGNVWVCSCIGWFFVVVWFHYKWKRSCTKFSFDYDIACGRLHSGQDCISLWALYTYVFLYGVYFVVYDWKTTESLCAFELRICVLMGNPLVYGWWVFFFHLYSHLFYFLLALYWTHRHEKQFLSFFFWFEMRNVNIIVLFSTSNGDFLFVLLLSFILLMLWIIGVRDATYGRSLIVMMGGEFQSEVLGNGNDLYGASTSEVWKKFAIFFTFQHT